MKKQFFRKWISGTTVLCMLAVSMQAGIMGITASADAADGTAADAGIAFSTGEEYYYDLADGNYLVTSTGDVTVNGEAVESGTELAVPGEYAIVKSEDVKTTTQNVVLYRQGDLNADNAVNVIDLVAIKKVIAGGTLTKVKKMAIDVNADDTVDAADVLLMKKNVLGLDTFADGVNATSYNNGIETEMPIGGFWGPNDQRYANSYTGYNTPDYISDRFYKLIADCGVNLITYTANTATPATKRTENVKKELALAEKYGLGMFVSSNLTNTATADTMANCVKDFSSYNSFKGISIADEPSSATYPNPEYWASWNHGRDMVNNAALARLINGYANLTGYVNLLPYWSNNGTAQNYADYLEEYCTTYSPKQLSFDYYVYNRASITDCSEYFENLGMVRQVSIDHNVPFWAFVQAGNDFRDNGDNSPSSKYLPSEAQFRWNVNMSLAYGAKGIQYFPLLQPYFYSHTGTQNDFARNALIGADGTPTQWYDYAKSVNKNIAAVDDVLMKAESKGIIPVGTYAVRNVVGTNVLSSYNELTSVSVPALDHYGAVVGCFDYYGKTALYVVNYDINKARDITLNFDGAHTAHVISSALTDTVSGNSCTVSLEAGGAALVLIDSVTQEQQTKINRVITTVSTVSTMENAEMPKNYTAVYNAIALYDSLSNREKANVPESVKTELKKLTEMIAGYADVYHFADCSADNRFGIDYKWNGTITDSVDPVYGRITEFKVDSTVGGCAQFVDELLTVDPQYDTVKFYVYNPLATDVTAEYSHNWSNTKPFTLTAGAWTEICVPASDYNGKVAFFNFWQDISCANAWKISDIYAVNSNALPAAVVNMINALPYYTELTLDDQAAVEAARSAYDALSAESKAQVDNLSVLEQCEARMRYLISYAAGNLPIVVDASCQNLGTDGALAMNVIDDTYGKVYTLSDATYFTLPAALKDANFLESKTVVFYMYNPTNADVNINYTMDWGFYRYAVLKANAWTRVEFTDYGTAANRQMISNVSGNGTVYFYGDFGADGWKLTSFFGMKEYGLNDIQSDKVVFDVAENAFSCSGTVTNNVDDATFGKVMTFSNASWLALDGVKQSEEFAASKAAYFYIYNPTDNDVQGDFTMDWDFYGYYLLKANSWTRVYLADFQTTRSTYRMLTGGATIYFDGAFTGDGWKVTSIYGVFDPEEETPESSDPIVIDAETSTYAADGGVVSGMTDASFGAVNVISASTYVAITPNLKSDAFKNSQAVYCYMYNPTNADVNIYWTQDWCYNQYAVLKAKAWTRIEMTNVVNAAGSFSISDNRTIYIYGAFKGMGWKMTSFYGINTYAADNIGNGLIVKDAANALGVDGTLQPNVSDATFGAVQSVSDSTYIALTERSKQEGFHDAQAVAFYVYNPTSADVNINYTTDWGYYAYATLKANAWTRIYLTDQGANANSRFVSTTDTIYFYGAFTGSGWKVSPFYGVEF
ncbi:MAG: dockerin type I repeat-containing protein [Clostridia bacterium]|nr:dockerin type I repeat-containing protein [Clostridia bacterium]